MQIDPRTGEIDCRDGGGGAIQVKAGGIWSLARVVIEIKFDGNALGNSSVSEIARG